MSAEERNDDRAEPLAGAGPRAPAELCTAFVRYTLYEVQCTMKTVSTKQLRDGLAGALGCAASGHERLVVTRRGRRVAALVPIDDLAALEELEDRKDARAARAALDEFRASGQPPIPFDDLARELAEP